MQTTFAIILAGIGVILFMFGSGGGLITGGIVWLVNLSA